MNSTNFAHGINADVMIENVSLLKHAYTHVQTFLSILWKMPDLNAFWTEVVSERQEGQLAFFKRSEKNAHFYHEEDL